jgi:hypothetical protein
MMASGKCNECQQELEGITGICPNCSAQQGMSPLIKFTIFYFVGGLAAILTYGKFVDAPVAWFLAMNWLAVGLALAPIAYGLPRKNTSDVAGLLYWLGVAWLVILFAAAAILIWNDGISVQDLQLLMDSESV